MKRILAIAIVFLLLPAAALCQSLQLETKFTSTKHMSQAQEALSGSCWLCIKDGGGGVFFQTSVSVGGSTIQPFNMPPSGIQGVWVQCPKKGGGMLTDWQAGNVFSRRMASGMNRYSCEIHFTAWYFMWINYEDTVRLH